MPRIAPLPAPYPAEVQAHFDQVMPPGAPPLVLFTTLASSDRAWRKFRAGSLLDGRLISLREREIVINRTCARAGCEYEWGVHITAFAKGAKLAAAEIAATLDYPLDPSRWTPGEGALLATIDALHDRATLSDDEFAQLRAHFDDDQILEVLLLAGFYRTVAYLANGLNLPLESTAARFADFASA
ncbi:carboxymuconolactone decarboxylase family protein [Phenylobacterium sp.]|uniref:carboxymuconolactone decarboxylase family protein n=1 Tax=Phenylobacterium sp. TaxID=1871053 RepID=UPI0030F43BAE